MPARSLAVSMLILGSTGTAAMALPTLRPDVPSGATVELVASWRYHQNCAWRDGRWIVDLGIGRVVLCRPTRPGNQWAWRNDGRRQGWYDRRRSVWHNNDR